MYFEEHNMKIYTKKGDDGQTGLIGGKRVYKSDLRIEAYGAVDELNSYMGLLRDQETLISKKEHLISVQNDLFVIGSHLAKDPENTTAILPSFDSQSVTKLEDAMDAMDKDLPQLKSFVLPGGHQIVSYTHIARCICRRAERLVVALSVNEGVSSDILKFLNRLSDYLFVMSRWLSLELQIEEIPWVPRKT